MRIFIYEYITGGGLFNAGGGELDLLRREGEAMVDAIVCQFVQVTGVEVDLLRDARLPSPSLPANVHHIGRAEDVPGMLKTQAAIADWTILIAPEIDGILLDCARHIEAARGRLLSPSSTVIAITSDKRQTTTMLRRAGILAPRSEPIQVDERGVARLPRSISFPAVLKRTDGAGSLGMRLVEDAGASLRLGSGRWMLEEYVPGVATSAAVLCGAGGHVVLPPFLQKLDRETFSYAGGSRLQDARLQSRARQLAARAADLLPEPIGYIGVDIVLGDDPSGKRDAVIEINARLTTSIVGLCAIARTNLAEAMLAVARGCVEVPEFSDDVVSFTADGAVTRVSNLKHCTA